MLLRHVGLAARSPWWLLAAVSLLGVINEHVVSDRVSGGVPTRRLALRVGLDLGVVPGLFLAVIGWGFVTPLACVAVLARYLRTVGLADVRPAAASGVAAV